MQLKKILISILYCVCAGAQVKTSIADGATPPAVAPGAPVGAIAPSGLERINLYNGHLSAVVPLVSVGGRGEEREGGKGEVDALHGFSF